MTADGPSTQDFRDGLRVGSGVRRFFRRWVGTVGFAIGLVYQRARRGETVQFVATVLILAVAVSAMIVVTGISLELAAPAGPADEADLQVVPEGTGASLSAVVDVEAQRLDGAHERRDAIAAHENVVGVTPVLAEIIRVRGPKSDEPAFILAVGVVPGAETPSVAGVSTDALESGDPHYADGAYDGPYTADVVLTESAAELLNASADDELLLQPARKIGTVESHSVTRVESASEGGIGAQVPMAVFRLSELQAITGTDENDNADLIAVRTDGSDSVVREDLEKLDPNTTVVGDGGLDSAVESLERDDRALALAAAATLLGVGLCALVVTTTMGLVVEGDRRTIATLAALGFTTPARLTVVAVTVLALSLAGAALGLVGGILGVAAVNATAGTIAAVPSIATIDTWAVPYAFGVALVAGLFAMPYPLALTRRVSTLADLHR